MAKRKFKEQLPRPIWQAETLPPETIARIRAEAEAEGEELVIALCDVASDRLAPLSANACMRLLRQFDK